MVDYAILAQSSTGTVFIGVSRSHLAGSSGLSLSTISSRSSDDGSHPKWGLQSRGSDPPFPISVAAVSFLAQAFYPSHPLSFDSRGFWRYTIKLSYLKPSRLFGVLLMPAGIQIAPAARPPAFKLRCNRAPAATLHRRPTLPGTQTT